MSETRKTAAFGGVALVLLLFALLTAPQRAMPDDFLDRGETFFPEFTDPNVATTLEVIEFDGGTATARPFQVTFRNGRWTIPSHHDYAADGEDRLAHWLREPAAIAPLTISTLSKPATRAKNVGAALPLPCDRRVVTWTAFTGNPAAVNVRAPEFQ